MYPRARRVAVALAFGAIVIGAARAPGLLVDRADGELTTSRLARASAVVTTIASESGAPVMRRFVDELAIDKRRVALQGAKRRKASSRRDALRRQVARRRALLGRRAWERQLALNRQRARDRQSVLDRLARDRQVALDRHLASDRRRAMDRQALFDQLARDRQVARARQGPNMRSADASESVGSPLTVPISGQGGARMSVGGIVVDAGIASGLQALLSAASAAGMRLGGSGYRDPAAQWRLRQLHCPDPISSPPSACSPATARPGQSMHEKGLAIDFTEGGSLIESHNSAAFRWLATKAATFGFSNLPREPWHWSANGQ